MTKGNIPCSLCSETLDLTKDDRTGNKKMKGGRKRKAHPRISRLCQNEERNERKRERERRSNKEARSSSSKPHFMSPTRSITRSLVNKQTDRHQERNRKKLPSLSKHTHKIHCSIYHIHPSGEPPCHPSSRTSICALSNSVGVRPTSIPYEDERTNPHWKKISFSFVLPDIMERCSCAQRLRPSTCLR